GHKNDVLIKAVDALIALSDADGEFFAINDAQKGMSIFTPSMTLAVSTAYWYGDKNAQLLAVAQGQGRVTLDRAGLALATDLAQDQVEPRRQSSVVLRDGPDGNQGGIAVLRAGGLAAVLKFTAQGLSHGHYDKLSYSFHQEGDEVVQDYGLVRFVNIGQKGGGNYLPENTTWAKQSIAHNTMVLNRKSHFGGEYAVGSQHHSTLEYASMDDEATVTVYARETNAYPGADMRRAISLVSLPGVPKPLLVDLFRVSGQLGQIDLPTHYLGQLIETSAPLSARPAPVALGTNDGYQHIFEEATGSLKNEEALQFSWLASNRFYTMFRSTKPGDSFTHGRVGANDPDFNLRRDPVLIHHRATASDQSTFVSIIDSHGGYSPVTELSTGQRSHIRDLKITLDTPAYTVANIALQSGDQFVLAWAHTDFSEDTPHEIRLPQGVLRWVGPQAVEAM
ncbi:heparinase II/III-family protein, partial [Luminiphilus sp.]|nr:heparinase II/III-family protein [Luminiphilus sp.]